MGAKHSPFQSVPEREAQVAKIAEFLSAVPDGEEVTWLRVESETGIPMDPKGKGFARTALKRLRRPWEAVRSVGIRMSSAATALTIVAGKVVRIDNAVRRADRTRAQLADRHMTQMGHQDQQRFLTLAGFFGAVRAFAKEATGKILK